MKQKLVMKLTLNDAKRRSKAMKIAVALPGVKSAALEGSDMNQIVIVGEGVDSIQLVNLLRKKMGFTELVSVTPIDEEKKNKEEQQQPSNVVVGQDYQYSWPSGPHHVCHVYDNSQESCVIM